MTNAWLTRISLPRILQSRQLLLSGGLILAIILLALLAPVISPHDPTLVSGKTRFASPCMSYPLGADFLGRDVLSNILYGARTSLSVGIFSMTIALVCGTVAGLLSGYFRGWLESIIMRAVETILCFPTILIAIFMVGFIGSSLGNLVFVIAVVYTPRFARIAYASTLSIRENTYIESAHVIGAHTPRILFRHILPNILAPLFVQFSMSLGQAILLESGLSFLGLGPAPPTPSWGRLIDQSRRFMHLSIHGVTWPALAISITVLGFNLLGDSLRDQLDPRLRGKG